MQVTRIGWAGTRTGGYSAMVEIAGPPGGDAGNGVAGVLVGVDDPLQHRLQSGGRRRVGLLHTVTVAFAPDRVASACRRSECRRPVGRRPQAMGPL
jgi:hypothetical protein